MQNVGFVRRSSDQLHHKKSYSILLGRHITIIKNRSIGRRIKITRLEIYQVGMTEHTKQHQLQKKTKRYTPEQKVYMEIGKNMVHQSGAVKQTHKNMGLTGSKEEPQSIKFEKPKCSSCKQNEIRSHRERIFLHTGAAQHHIHENSKYSITHHFHKTWNISEYKDWEPETTTASKNKNVKLLTKTSYQEEKESQGVAHWTSRTSFSKKTK